MARCEQTAVVQQKRTVRTYRKDQKADLTHAHLVRADLWGPCPEGADLQWAHLEKADLSSAHLARANVEGAYLNGADLTNAKGLTRRQLETAKTDKNTRLPDYLKRNADDEKVDSV